MKLSGAQFEELVTLVSEGIELPAFKRIVKFKLEVDIEDIAADVEVKIDVAFKVINWSMKQQRLESLLEGFIKENSTLKDPLSRIIAEAQRADRVTAHVAVAAALDPLARFFPREQPFVDRVDLIRGLDQMWTHDQSGVLVVRGDRYSGRSHSWLRISEAAEAAKVITYLIDVSRNPGVWTVAGIVDRIVTLLKVDRRSLKDSLAQGSTQAGALIGTLITHFDRHVAGDQRSCLVMDGLDRPGVDPAIIELMEELIAEVLAANTRGLSLIILGYGEHSPQAFGHLILTEKIQWITPCDIQTWLASVLQAAGKAAVDGEITATSQTILDGLAPPFNAVSMSELRSRVKQHTVDLLRRLP